MRTRLGPVLLALVAGATLPAVALETPRYEIVSRDDGIEIRSYRSYLVAETLVDASFRDAGNAGFRRLFRYIAGANTDRAEISMTAPVSQQPTGTRIAMTAPVAQVPGMGGHWVSFVVPSSFSMENVPRPTDARVRIREVPAQLVAVARYSGTWSERRFRRDEQRLRQAIASSGYETAGEPQFARYDPPYVPPFFRRNEILIPLAGERPGG